MSNSNLTRVPMYHQILVISQPNDEPVWVDLSKNSVTLSTISDKDFAMLERGATRIQDCVPVVELTLSDSTILSDENTVEVF
jgi:hypothetical protein